MHRAVTLSIALLALLLLLGAGYLFQKQPKTAAAWNEAQARTAYADERDGTFLMHNVRDWTYDESGPVDTRWTEVAIDPASVTRVWFLLEPFADIKAIGHTFLTFELEDGTFLSFSVEALREEGEEYSALKGLFREYELSYQWGFERDFVTRRLYYLNHPLHLYPLTLSKEEGAALLRSLIAESNALKETPRFYNTLTANCTNVLAKIVNRHFPGTLPYDLSWNLTGLSDGYLMREGLIPLRGSAAETRDSSSLAPHKESLRDHLYDPAFSQTLRTFLPE
ncbi:MAG TPA: DUF4105 domain-containing protein [Candidatus Paceibacterota bacterium]|nr:DUF4105 domain-containing protein [Candidatus Paceibacterota bacterium]